MVNVYLFMDSQIKRSHSGYRDHAMEIMSIQHISFQL